MLGYLSLKLALGLHHRESVYSGHSDRKFHSFLPVFFPVVYRNILETFQ